MTAPPPTPTAALLRAVLHDFRRTWLALAVYEAALKLLAGPLVVAAWLLAVRF
jgi:hypothetical protein